MAEKQLSELCKILSDQGFDARLEGKDCAVHAVNTLEGAKSGEITFLANPKYESAVAQTRASAVILKDDLDVPAGLSAIRCAEPYAAVTLAIITLHGYRKHPQWGKSESAEIHASANIGANANIAAGVTIAADVTIGDNCTIYPGCYVAEGTQIGHDCILFPNVVIYDRCEVGHRVTIHAGSVVGEDGLGYAPYEGKWIKIPQVGRAVLGDDVEIGANCTIDRATLGQTEIGSGTKFGNIVVVGHGTKIGKDCMFVGLVGLAGSANVGNHVTIAGQAGVAGHVHVGDDVTVAGQSGVTSDIKPGMTVLGLPAEDARDTKRVMAATKKLPALIKRLQALENEVKELRGKLEK